MCLGSPGRIVRYLDDAHHVAVVDLGGVERTVNTGMVAEDADPPGPGEWVLVHMGIALQRLTPEEADVRTSAADDLLAEFERMAEARERVQDGQ